MRRENVGAEVGTAPRSEVGAILGTAAGTKAGTQVGADVGDTVVLCLCHASHLPLNDNLKQGSVY